MRNPADILMKEISPDGKKKRIYSLDLLKFGAAVIIIFHHFQQSFEITFGGINFFGGRINFGYAVEMFFILSGFFMSMGSAKYSKERFGKFMKNRAIRLFPMAAISITVYAFIAVLFVVLTGDKLTDVGLWKYITSVTLTFAGGIVKIDGTGFNNPTWYLCVLLICYALFRGALALSEKYKSNECWLYAALMLTGLGVRSYGLDLPILNERVARGMIPFFLGCLLYHIYIRVNSKKATICSLTILLIAIGAAAVSYDAFYDDLQMILVFMIYPALILFLLSSRLMDTIFNHRFFGELGKISFEMYLWHIPVFGIMKLLIGLGVYEMSPSYMTMIITTAIVTLVATIIYITVEKPITTRLLHKTT